MQAAGDGRGEQPASVVTNQATGVITGSVVQAQAIHGDIHLWPAEASLPIPRQLPKGPAYFTSRSRESRALDHMAGALPAVALLVGQAGVGKSALAVLWARRNAHRFPDGQLYVDLRGFSADRPVSSGQALGRLLRALGVPPQQVPLEAEEQAALYRSLMSGRRVLVVVDDAPSASQVRPLLPVSDGSMALVTSRLRLGDLHGDGAVFVPLAPLEHEDAVEMLVRSLGEKRTTHQLDQLSQLAALCDHLPIALSIVGARLASRPQ